MEPRPIYDITEEGDRAEAASFLARGVEGLAFLVPEDLDVDLFEDLLKKAGASRVEVDASKWPREVVVKTERGTYRFVKVEEGVYRALGQPH